MTTKYRHVYDFLIVRKNYPRERGYRMEHEPLPPWIHLSINKEGDSKYLTVHSRIHISKNTTVGPAYSLGFSDLDIIKDLSGDISERFL